MGLPGWWRLGAGILLALTAAVDAWILHYGNRPKPTVATVAPTGEEPSSLPADTPDNTQNPVCAREVTFRHDFGVIRPHERVTKVFAVTNDTDSN